MTQCEVYSQWALKPPTGQDAMPQKVKSFMKLAREGPDKLVAAQHLQSNTKCGSATWFAHCRQQDKLVYAYAYGEPGAKKHQ